MGRSLSKHHWDELLDGKPREVDVLALNFEGGLPSFRAAVYREAEKRFGYARTKRLSGTLLQVQGFECRVAEPPSRRLSSPAPQDQPPSDTEPLSEEDTEALLGPCTCGQDPTCLPSCERFS